MGAGLFVLSMGLLAILVMAVTRQPLAATAPEPTGDLTRALGETVLTRFVLPFELLALLMLAALLGAVYFARPED